MSAVRRFRDRAEYALFSGAVRATNLLSDRAAARFGAFAGRLGYAPFRIRRSLVEAQLRQAFPERDDAWIRRTARASYEHLGRETIALLRMARLTPEQVLARTELVGFPEALEALALGRGLVVVAGHLGNWEIGAAVFSVQGYPVDVIVSRQRNPYFNEWVARTRGGMGLGIIERREAPRRALQSLRAGRAVAFAADQNAGRSGVFVPFFGRPASTHRGPALMALRTGAPMFLCTPLRVGENRYRVTLEEVEVDRGGDADEAVYRMTAAFTARLEQAVRSAPEQYLWQHRRWRTRPPARAADGREEWQTGEADAAAPAEPEDTAGAANAASPEGIDETEGAWSEEPSTGRQV